MDWLRLLTGHDMFPSVYEGIMAWTNQEVKSGIIALIPSRSHIFVQFPKSNKKLSLPANAWLGAKETSTIAPFRLLFRKAVNDGDKSARSR